MSQIMKAFMGVFLTLFMAVTAMGILAAYMEVMNAQDMQARIVDEIENSDFNENVINTCVSQGADAGYQVEVTPCTYDENNNMRTAEVVVSYEYKLPLFGISGTKSTRGIAR